MTNGEIALELPSVIVLLATYNGASHLGEQIRSLARQTNVRVHVLLSDDGSSDGTVKLACEEAAACDLSLTLLPQLPSTGSAARNFFRLFRDAEFTGYEFVALCDQDDIWSDDKLELACSQLAKSLADVYSCNVTAFWDNGQTKVLRKNYSQRRYDYLFESASQGCTYVMRASVAVRFAQMLAEREVEVSCIDFHDWLLYAWARSQNATWFMDAATCMRYRQTSSNVIGANSGSAAIRRRIHLLRRGWLRGQAIRTAVSIGMGNDPVVEHLLRFTWRDRLILAFRAAEFRRRRRDQMVFFMACLTIGL